MNNAIGIDVSKWQQDKVNWQEIKKAGVSFVFLRCSVGGQIDPYFESNYAGASGAGLLIGVYHYLMPLVDTSVQVNTVYTAIKSKRLDLPVVIDVEEHGLNKDLVLFMLRGLEAKITNPLMFYTSAYKWNTLIGKGYSEIFSKYPLWVAHYTTASKPLLPSIWTTWEFWQYTDSGKFNGYAGGLDTNRFNGTETQLVAKYRPEQFKLRWPTDYKTVTQPFGANPQIYAQWGLPGHEGIDIRAPHSSSIYACADGVVYGAYESGPYGRQVRIDHHNGYKTIYAHLDKWLVSDGEEVKEGQVIGLADNTGNSFGSHLHLTLKKDGATASGETKYPNDIVDPTPYLYFPVSTEAIYVRTKSKNGQFVRKEANTNNPPIAVVYPNTVLETKLNADQAHVIGTPEWIQVKLPTGMQGWMYALYLEKVE